MSYPFAINFAGATVPFNTDNLPERRFLFGQGTPKPLGFSEVDMVKLYWTVRSFNVNILATLLPDAFLTGLEGASTGTLAGTVIGLNNVANLFSQGGGIVSGKTKVKNLTTIKNRLPNSVQINPNANPKFVVGSNGNVNEGVLCAAGPVHTLRTGSSQIQIDFSDILFAKNLYWPTIIITMPLITSTLFTVTPLGQTTNSANGPVIGNVNFMGSAINLYGTSTSVIDLIVAFGSITIGNGCCSRFYFDGKDKERVTTYCPEGCAEIGFTA